MPSDDENQFGSLEKLLHSWAANWRCDADKGDRYFGSPLIVLALAGQLTREKTSSPNGPERLAACSSLPPSLWLVLHSGSRYGSALVGSSDPVTGRLLVADDGYHTVPYFTTALVKVWSAHYLVQQHHSLMGSTLLCGVMDYAVEYPTCPSGRLGIISNVCRLPSLLMPALLLLIGVVASLWHYSASSGRIFFF